MKKAINDDLKAARVLLLEADKKARVACAKELAEVCGRHGFTMRVQSQIVLIRTQLPETTEG